MRKTLSVFFTLMIFMQIGLNIAAANTGYEKYGQIAIAVVKADYPSNEVTDYQYKGRTQNPNGQAEDSFRFIVDEKGKEITVKVKVRHDLNNKKMLKLTVEEIGQ